jgi:hypothetical protein
MDEDDKKCAALGASVLQSRLSIPALSVPIAAVLGEHGDVVATLTKIHT